MLFQILKSLRLNGHVFERGYIFSVEGEFLVLLAFLFQICFLQDIQDIQNVGFIFSHFSGMF